MLLVGFSSSFTAFHFRVAALHASVQAGVECTRSDAAILPLHRAWQSRQEVIIAISSTPSGEARFQGHLLRNIRCTERAVKWEFRTRLQQRCTLHGTFKRMLTLFDKD